MSKAVSTAAAKFVDMPDGKRVQQIVRVTEKQGAYSPYLDVEMEDIALLRITHKNYPLTVFDKVTGDPRRNAYLVRLLEACGLDADAVLDNTDWEVDEQKAVLIGHYVTGEVFHRMFDGTNYANIGEVTRADQSIARERHIAAIAAARSAAVEEAEAVAKAPAKTR